MTILADPDLTELVRDLEDQDNARGPEAEPDDAAFFQIVQQLHIAPIGGSGQCSECGGTFEDFNGGICNVCQSRLAKQR